MIFIKKHAADDDGTIIAMCDEELIGRVLKQGKLLIDLDRYAEFYRGELVDEERAEAMVENENIHSANVVGERSVAIMVSRGLASMEEVRKVNNVPFVQIFRLDL